MGTPLVAASCRVVNVLRIQQRRRARAIAGDALAKRLRLERERLSEVLLRLAAILQKLQMQRAQEARGLAQDRDDRAAGCNRAMFAAALRDHSRVPKPRPALLRASARTA